MKMNRTTHPCLRTFAALATLLLVGSFATVAVAQDTCEIPLFVKQNLVGANVMFLADNSGSMNSAICHLGYDAEVVYTGEFTSGSTYFVAKDGLREPSDFGLVAISPSVYLVNSDNGEDGRYTGNYLNWMYYDNHASDAQRLAVPRITRIQVLKEVLLNVINRSERLNIGLTVFQNNDGGNIIGKCGVSYVSLASQIAGLTANTWTPLGEAAETVLDYFSYDGPDAAIQVSCQYNFVIVVTDGLPTMDLAVSAYLHDADGDGNDPGNCTSLGAGYPDFYDCSDHFDDVTWWMANKDLRPDMEDDQVVSTYVVGFHENGQLLQEAALNGDGLFFHAENAVELIMSIEYAIQDILRRISAGSAVAVVSTERGTDDRLYRGKFMPIDWDGFLESYRLPYNAGDSALWEAGSLLQARSTNSRDIFTALGNHEYSFTATSAGDLAAAMNAVDDAEAADLINWGRGNYVAGLRNRRGWVLGDIVHSTPVVVGSPSGFHATPDYQTFYNNYESRPKSVYVGANDGMVHNFDAISGEERWAFVPEFALPKFAAMADSGYCHTYTCDQTMSVADLQINGSWRTVLVSNGREGGSSLFALDVTDPNSPDVMWQQQVPNDKKNLSVVEIVNIDNRPIALVGSGIDVDLGKAWIYAYDIETGALTGEQELSDLKVRNKATKPTVIDTDRDGNINYVYIGDMSGSLWRFEVDGEVDPARWGMTKLFAGAEEITASPAVTLGENGDVWVYFGTGAYIEDPDMLTDAPQYFYGLIDHHDLSTLNYRDLTNQTTNPGDIGTDSGWYVELWGGLGERVTEQAVIIAENVIFTSFAPSLDACVAGGESWLYQMAYDSGSNPQSEEENPDDTRQTSLGEGIASYPVVDLTEGKVVVQSSDASISVEDIASVYMRLVVRAWTETWAGATQTADANP